MVVEGGQQKNGTWPGSLQMVKSRIRLPPGKLQPESGSDNGSPQWHCLSLDSKHHPTCQRAMALRQLSTSGPALLRPHLTLHSSTLSSARCVAVTRNMQNTMHAAVSLCFEE